MIRVPRRERTRVGRSRPSTPMQTYRPQQVTRYQTTVERASEVPMTLQANPTPERPRSQFPKGKDSLSEIAKALTDPTYAAEKRAEAIAPLKVVESQGEVFDLDDMEKKIKLIEGIPGHADDTELALQLFKLKEQLAIRKAAGGEKLPTKFNTAPIRKMVRELSSKSDKTIDLEVQSNIDARKRQIDGVFQKMKEKQAENAMEADIAQSKADKQEEYRRELVSQIFFKDYDPRLYNHLDGPAAYAKADPSARNRAFAAYFLKPTQDAANKLSISKPVMDLYDHLESKGDIDELTRTDPRLIGKMVRLATTNASKVGKLTMQETGDMFKSLQKQINGANIPDHLLPLAYELFMNAQNKWARNFVK